MKEEEEEEGQGKSERRNRFPPILLEEKNLYDGGRRGERDEKKEVDIISNSEGKKMGRRKEEGRGKNGKKKK